MTTPFYITTPIYYVNDVPHLGHAYTTIVADALAPLSPHARRRHAVPHRHRRARPEDRGDREEARDDAAAARRSRRAAVRRVLEDARHHRLPLHPHDRGQAQARRRGAVEADPRAQPEDLYLASYQGWYCVGCEAFYTESQLVKDGERWLCAIHKTPVDWLDKERSWFFRLSRYAEPLLAHIEAHPEFIQPAAYEQRDRVVLEGGPPGPRRCRARALRGASPCPRPIRTACRT